MYVCKPKTKTCLDYVLDIAQVYKSIFKNSHATKRKVQNLWSSTDRKKDSIDWMSYSVDFKSGPKFVKTFRVYVLHYLV